MQRRRQARRPGIDDGSTSLSSPCVLGPAVVAPGLRSYCSLSFAVNCRERRKGSTMPKVEVLSRKRVFDDFFKVEEAYLRFERFDGTMSEAVRRLNLERGDAVAALLVHPGRGTVYLVRQFMYPTLEKAGGWLDTVVAGMIDAGETPEAAVRREILEEAGFTVDKVEP